jgi:hypothetical protein
VVTDVSTKMTFEDGISESIANSEAGSTTSVLGPKVAEYVCDLLEFVAFLNATSFRGSRNDCGPNRVTFPMDLLFYKSFDILL